VNIIASVRGNTAIAIGNVVGSNIFNTLLVLGVSSMIFPLTVKKGIVWKGIPLTFLAALLLGILANDHFIDKSGFSALTRIDGLVFISFFIIFLYYSISTAEHIEGMHDHVPQKKHGMIRSSLLIVIGLMGLGLGGEWIVKGAIHVAQTLGASQSFISLTLVAVGTSLPELTTSAVAAYKKNVEIAVGNVVGSNIFNIFFVLGVSSMIRPLPFQAKHNLDIGLLIVANILLFITMFTGKKLILDRWEGIGFVILYVCYLVFLIIQG
jgi:cation:H+ antiporter